VILVKERHLKRLLNELSPAENEKHLPNLPTSVHVDLLLRHLKSNQQICSFCLKTASSVILPRT
jgi:hypothetical protein